MSKKRKKKPRKQQRKASDGMLAFKKCCCEFLDRVFEDDSDYIPLKDNDVYIIKRILTQFRTPKKYSNSLICSAEIRLINKVYQHFIRDGKIAWGDSVVSILEYNILSKFLLLRRFQEVQKNDREEFDFSEVENRKDMNEDQMLAEMVEMIPFIYSHTFYRVICGLSDVRKKIYCAEFVKVDEGIYQPYVSAFCAIERKIKIDGISRAIYKVGIPSVNKNEHKWAQISTCLLGDHYYGDQDQLDIYIQTHALKRLEERLDVFDIISRNFVFADSMCEIEHVELSRNHILIPVQLVDKKLGYFFCNVIDEKLIIRTFLFLTHNATPEGEKLKKYMGLQTIDVHYWQIDKLSTLIQMDERHWPKLMELFEKVGIKDAITISDLFMLKDVISKEKELSMFSSYLRHLKIEIKNVKQDNYEKVY